MVETVLINGLQLSPSRRDWQIRVFALDMFFMIQGPNHISR